MSVIATAASLGGVLCALLAASSGPMIGVIAAFFAGGTLGGLLGALAVAVLGLRGAWT